MRAPPPAIAALIENARCFNCLPPSTQFEVQTYIMAYVLGEGVDPKELAYAAKDFQALSAQTLQEIKAYLLATIAGYNVNPNSLAERAKCYICIPDGMISDVQTYLLSIDPNGPGITSPNALAAAAKAFSNWPIQTLLEIQVYILARLSNSSTNPNELADAAKCISCLPLPVISEVSVGALDYLEVGGGGGIGPEPPIPCLDDPVQQIPVIAGTYTDGILTSVDILLPQVCCHPHHVTIYEADDAIGTGAVAIATGLVGAAHAGEINYTLPTLVLGAPPAKPYVLATQSCQGGPESAYSNALEVDLTCGVATAFILVQGAGEADANGVYTWDQAEYDSSGRFVYINGVTNWFIEFTNGGTGVEAWLYSDAVVTMYHLPLGECFPCGTWSNDPPDNGAAPVPTCSWSTKAAEQGYDWAARVVTNGGAAVADATRTAVIDFYQDLEDADIVAKFKTLNLYVPDNLTAARTPLIVGVGSDPWSNTLFVAGDLTVNGLIGDGTKYLDTGVDPSTAFASDATGGISIYHLGPNAGTDVECGSTNATGGNCILFWAQFAGNTYWQCYANAGGGTITYASPAFTGFISMNRTSNTDTKIYDANSGSAFTQRATGAGNLGNRPIVGTMVAHGYNNNGAKTASSKKRISFLAIHDGLTSGQAQALYNAVQAFRVAIGGGYV